MRRLLADREQALYELAAPAGSLQRGLPVAWHEQRAGSLITINAIAVSVGVQLWLELLAGRLSTSTWHRLDWDAQTGLRVHAGSVGVGDECPYCRS